MKKSFIFILLIIFVFTAESNVVLYAQTDVRQQNSGDSHSVFPSDTEEPELLQSFVSTHQQNIGEFQSHREKINSHTLAPNNGMQAISLSNLEEAWVKHYASGLGSSLESAIAIVVDNAGNVIVTGSGTGDGLSYGSSYDYVTIKYDAFGNELWVARYNGPGNSYDYAKALAVDGSGNVYVTGYSWGSGSSYDYATIKYNASGNELWVARYDGTGNSYAYDIAVDGSGNVYVTGSSWSSATSYDYTTIKYDATGNQLWIEQYNGPWNADDGATALAVDGSGNVYVTGWSTGSGTAYDYATIKYDASGNQLWVARYNGPGYENDIARAVSVDGSGNVIVTGVSVGLGTWDDYATIKYDASGNELWVARYNGPGNGGDGATALAVDGSGNVYVTGYCWDSGMMTMDDYATVKYDPSGNQLWVAFYNGSMNGIDRASAIDIDGSGNVYVTGTSMSMMGGDAFTTIKYDYLGNEIWTAVYDGNSIDRANAIAVDGTGNIYVAGFSYGVGVDTRDDFTTIKYDTGGNQLWFAWYNGPGNSWDGSNAMAVDGSGNVYVTGSSNRGEGINIDYATIKYDAAGNEIWVARYVCPGESWGVPKDIAVDGSGNVYVTGYVWVSGTVYIDYITIKYDAFGNQLWVAQYNGPGSANDYAYAIAVDGSGNVYVTGGSVGIGTTYDYATIKYDASGNELWVARYNGPAGNGADYANAIAVDGSGNVYVTGESRIVPTGYSYDYATIKYDAAGNELWVARYNGPGNNNDRGQHIAVDNSGNVIVTGNSRGSGTLEDYGTIKYDASGNELWVARYNGPGNSYDNAAALAVDGSGNVYVTGGSVGIGTTYDYSTIKYDASGAEFWVARYNMGPEATAESAADLAVDNSGNVYVTGSSFSDPYSYLVTIKYDASGNQLSTALYKGPGDASASATAIALDALDNIFITGSFALDMRRIIGTIKYVQVAPTTFQLTVSIENSWNMVSIPGLHPVDQNVLTWWVNKDPSANVFKYDGGYQPVATVEPGTGYWMKHLGNQVYNTGDEWPSGGILYVDHDPISANAGWNLIGGYEEKALTSGITTTPGGLQTGFVYGYSTTGGYQVADTLIPGYGYWIKLTDDGLINIPSGVEGASKIAGNYRENWGKIILTDAAGRSYTLYAVNDKVDLNAYQLPPAPPSGLFDIRYGSGRFAENLSAGIQSIEMKGIEYPVRVKVENMSLTLQDETGKEINAELKSGEEITISNNSINKLLVISGEVVVPIEYALEQNYPNPFNPATTIKFSVPEATNVALNIYTVLGEKVAELVNTKLDAGKYSYQWDARNVATGIYIYELRTDKFVSIKKMILLH